MGKAEDSLKNYLNQLNKSYDSLNRILLLEADDISNSDENSLQKHSVLEKATVEAITALTKSVQTYIEKVKIDSAAESMLKSISGKKNQAQNQIAANLENLKTTMKEIEHKINSIKLPKSARRVYYSGNNPTMMDIEI